MKHAPVVELAQAESQEHLDAGGSGASVDDLTASRATSLGRSDRSGRHSELKPFAPPRRDDRADALHVYDQLRTLLREELGTAPSPSTQELHRALLD